MLNIKKLIQKIEEKNIFKASNNELIGVGKINPVIEEVNTNSVKVYSIHDISNVRFKDDTYKSRINHSITTEGEALLFKGSILLGDVTMNVLNVNITPTESEVINGSTTITYSCNGTDNTITMPILDNVISKEDTSIFWTSHILFNPYNDSGKDLRQTVSIDTSEEDSPIFISGNIVIKKFKTKPAIFSNLNKLSLGKNVNAILAFNDNGANTEFIPVKLTKSGNNSKMDISIGQGYNAGVIEIKNSQLLFHCSDEGGRLYNQFVISTNGSVISTDTNIINKAKMLYQKEYGMVGIAMKADGSPITEEEAKNAGFII